MPTALIEDKNNPQAERKRKFDNDEADNTKKSFVDKLGSVAVTQFESFFVHGVIVFLVFILILTNIASITATFFATKFILEKKYLHKEGISKSTKFSGPLIRLNPEPYNLRSDGEPLFLKLTVCLEMESNKMIDEVRDNIPRIQNLMSEIVTNKPVEQFNSLSGIQYARRLMLESINKILVSGHIVDVYFLEYIIVKSDRN